MYSKLAAFTSLIAAARAQNFCTQTTETHPPLSWQRCASGGSCSSVSGSVVIDSNWRWTHTTSGTTNCYSGNTWDNTLCPNNQACTQNCCIDGADYSATYGVTTSGNSLNLKFVTNGPYSKNIGSRLYLMASDTKYQMFNLLGNEFTFDVDVSNIGCGLNGALYFVNMDEDGGMARFSTNKAGAKYGTGYCDSQCPSDVKFINGQANREGWVPSSNDANAGTGGLGACCGEMDIWEANKISSAYTPHPCTNANYHSCVGNSCGGTYSTDRYAGDCDPDGCDFNSWRQGNRTFYGPGSSFTVNTEQKMTVVTQFLTSGGALSEIKRFYVQNGKVIPNSQSTIAGVSGNSITADYCAAQKVAFGDTNSFAAKGGMTGSSTMLSKPMVLVMSLWDDHYANMLWLDSTYPTTSTKVGASRGSCPITSGVPAEVEAQVPNSNVIFSNIKFGPIGSTFNSNGGGTTNPTTTTSTGPGTPTTPPSGGTVPQWGQCGGNNWTGPTSCVSPFTCTKVNDWYSQCL